MLYKLISNCECVLSCDLHTRQSFSRVQRWPIHWS